MVQSLVKKPHAFPVTTVFDVVADFQRPQAALVVGDAGSLEIEAAAAQHARQRRRREVS
jgi:hypothetical protein